VEDGFASPASSEEINDLGVRHYGLVGSIPPPRCIDWAKIQGIASTS